MCKGYTIVELMISLLLASLLSVVLVMTYSAIQKRFQLVMALSMMQDDAQFLIIFLRDKINHAGDRACVTSSSLSSVQVYSKETTPNDLKTQLHNESDVLVLGTCEMIQGKKAFVQTAYYITTASWKEHGNAVKAFFEKPLNSSRQELVAHVEDFHVSSIVSANIVKGIGYELTFRSNNLFRTWHGFGVIHNA